MELLLFLDKTSGTPILKRLVRSLVNNKGIDQPVDRCQESMISAPYNIKQASCTDLVRNFKFLPIQSSNFKILNSNRRADKVHI